MTETPTRGDDSILPFQLDALDLRGRVARLDRSIDAILSRHSYPAPVSGLLAEAVLLAALIGQAIGARSRFSIQLRGDGPVSMIATDYFAPETPDAPARLRGWASFDAARFDADAAPFALLGSGLFGVLIDQGGGTAPYQGVTPLAGASLADCAETYFAQSEQIATRFVLASALASAPGGGEAWRAAGVMLQHLPEASPHALPPERDGTEASDLMRAEDVVAMSGAAQGWNTAALKLATVEAHELLGPHVSPESLLIRLFNEDGPRVYTPRPLDFGCTCSAAKVEGALAAYEPEQIADMRLEDGTIDADCQFCGARYRFDPESGSASAR